MNKVTVIDPECVTFTVETTWKEAIALRSWMNAHADPGSDPPKLVWDIIDGLRNGMRGKVT